MLASCALQGKNKPDRCKSYPTVYDYLIQGCGFWFDDEGNRRGKCLRCGKCCAVPRVNGEPGSGYDPYGEPCKYLIMEVE